MNSNENLKNISVRENCENDKYVHLCEKVNIRGQLFPLDLADAKKYRTKIGLVTGDGREFYVRGTRHWRIALWRHLWDFVVVSGTIDYCERTIIVRSFQPEEYGFGEFVKDPGENEFSPFEVNDFIDKMINRGRMFPVAV